MSAINITDNAPFRRYVNLPSLPVTDNDITVTVDLNTVLDIDGKHDVVANLPDAAINSNNNGSYPMYTLDISKHLWSKRPQVQLKFLVWHDNGAVFRIAYRSSPTGGVTYTNALNFGNNGWTMIDVCLMHLSSTIASAIMTRSADDGLSPVTEIIMSYLR